MEPIFKVLDLAREYVRRRMNFFAHVLNNLFGVHLSPNMVTMAGLIMHLPIAGLIAVGLFIPAAILLVVFGLFDTLDGELARLQKRASNAGMLLDASTDRFKEVLLYSGVAYALTQSAQPATATWAVAACGASICVSYVKAKGETAVAGGKLSANEVNRLFQDGLFRFEVRMTLLVVGLLMDQLAAITVIIAVTSSWTAMQRLVNITRKLNVQS